MDASKASGPYSIPSRILKSIEDIVAEPLANIINLSLEEGVFPDRLKIAEVIPVHKKDSRLDYENYRPISLLSNLEKILRKSFTPEFTTFSTLTMLFSLNSLDSEASNQQFMQFLT